MCGRRTGEDADEGGLDSCGVQGRGLDESEVVLLREGHGLLGGDHAEVPEVGLVADEHYNNVGVGVLTQLLEPALAVLKTDVLRNVVDEEGADGAAVVPAAARAVSGRRVRAASRWTQATYALVMAR